MLDSGAKIGHLRSMLDFVQRLREKIRASMPGSEISRMVPCVDCDQTTSIESCTVCGKPVCPTHRSGTGHLRDGYQCSERLCWATGCLTRLGSSELLGSRLSSSIPFRTTPEQSAHIDAVILPAMKEARVDPILIAQASMLARIDQGVYALMALWVDDTTEQEAIESDLRKSLEDCGISSQRT